MNARVQKRAARELSRPHPTAATPTAWNAELAQHVAGQRLASAAGLAAVGDAVVVGAADPVAGGEPLVGGLLQLLAQLGLLPWVDAQW